MDAGSQEHKKLLDRLARVEGQVRALRRMMEDGRACEDVLTQLLAARSGLEQAGMVILEQHLDDCILKDSAITASARGELLQTMRLWSKHG
jgi:DNA-binding FrmR family transcriptional regulator